MYAYAFLGEFVLLYPVYALLFADAGLSTAQISSLFAIWSISSFALEIPSGVLADAISRRALLAAAPLLSASGFALWILAPSYPAFAVGFALWGAHGAVRSGALEALVYEELERLDAEARYPTLMGRATAIGTVAGAAATGLAAPVLASDGFTGVGLASIAASVAAAAVGATLPEHTRSVGRVATATLDGEACDRAVGDAEPTRCTGLLKTAVALVRHEPPVRRAVLLVAGVTAIWGSLDEYLPLLAVEAGASPTTVPSLALIVYAGMALGGLGAAKASQLPPRGLTVVLLGAAGALAAGSLVRVPAGFALIALAFGAFQALSVSADARLQAAIDGPARSTITSFAGLATEAGVLSIFAAYALGSELADHASLFALFASLHLVVALWLWPRNGPRRSATTAR